MIVRMFGGWIMSLCEFEGLTCETGTKKYLLIRGLYFMSRSNE